MSNYQKLREIVESRVNLPFDFDFAEASPSDAIRYAVQEFVKLTEHNTYFGLNFIVDMKGWVRIGATECSTCLAGAVIFSELGTDVFKSKKVKRYSPKDMPIRVAARLYFVDQMRIFIESGAAPDPNKSVYLKEGIKYLNNPIYFHTALELLKFPRTGYEEKPVELITYMLDIADYISRTHLRFNI